MENKRRRLPPQKKISSIAGIKGRNKERQSGKRKTNRKDNVKYNCCRWILQNLGDDLTEADIDDMIADVDTDGSGWVDYNGSSLLCSLIFCAVK